MRFQQHVNNQGFSELRFPPRPDRAAAAFGLKRPEGARANAGLKNPPLCACPWTPGAHEGAWAGDRLAERGVRAAPRPSVRHVVAPALPQTGQQYAPRRRAGP